MASSTREVIMLSLTFLCLNPLLKSCVALALPTTSVNSNPPGKLFARGGPSIQATDPWDRRWIEQLTAVGDSYSVGLGAGHAVKAGSQLELNTDCYQYSYGFPNIVNMDDMIGENNDRHFQYLGCSGALTNTIREKQVPKMQQSQAVLLSAGGNDAHLSTLLNYCVYQWTAIWPWTCDGELSKAEADVNSDSYLKSMTEMLKAIEGKLVDGNSRIYWAGYMRFFDTSTNECDEVTWAFTRVFGFRQFLTQARRERFNKITDLVNQKIQDACKTVDRCVYVDSEPEVDRNAGRYCMPGINEHYYGGIESPIDGWNRERTVYYEWSTTKDNDADDEKNIDQPQKREEMGQRGESFISLDRRSDTPGPLDNSTFEGAIGNWIIQGTQDGTLNVSATQFGEVNAQGLPDWIGRVFHLTKYGNAIVANGILRAMIAEQAKMMNQPADPFIIDPAQCHISGAEIDKLPPPAPAPAPYVVTGGNGAQAGKCHVHVSEYEKCGPDTSDLSTEVTIYDVGGNKIGFQSVKVAGATDPLPVKSKLEDLLIVTPEHRGNYIQFTLGTENFNSRQSDQMALAWCNTGGWDPREGPSCGGRIPQRSSKRQMDCYFQCPWHGGKPSDGS